MSKVKLIGKSIKFYSVSNLISTCIKFLLFPFIISITGKEIFGIYMLVMTMIGYINLADLGVSSALQKYVAEYKGKNDQNTLMEVISASFLFYLFVGIFAALCLYVLSYYFADFFNISKEGAEIGRSMLKLSALIALFLWPSIIFRGIAEGLQKYDSVAIITITTQILSAILIFLSLSIGVGIEAVLIINIMSVFLQNICLMWVLKKDINYFGISFLNVKKEIFIRIFSYGIYSFLGSVSILVIFELQNIIIGKYISMTAIAIYSASFLLHNAIRQLSSILSTSIVSVSSELYGMDEKNKLRELFFKGTKYMTSVLIPVVIISIIFCRPIIEYWVGDDFKDSILPAQILIFYWLFNGSIYIGHSILTGQGYVNVIFRALSLNAFMNLIITLALIQWIGILGVAIGTTIPMIIYSFIMITIILKKLEISISCYLKNCLMDNLILYIISFSLSIVLINLMYPLSLITTLFQMGIIFLLSIGFYFIIILSREERFVIRKLIGV